MSVEDRTPKSIEIALDQEVVDKEGKKLGKVRARFERYVLVERGGLFGKAYYVPHSVIRQSGKGALQLTLTEEELRAKGYHNLPEDLLPETPEPANPVVDGTPQFGRRPLSPAQTGHYNYGKLWPGINTDASGSYHRNEVLPHPQIYVEDAETDNASSNG